MKNPFKNAQPESARLAALVESLADKSTKLTARLADANKSAEAARAARTENLADASETELDALIAAVASAEGQISALASTLQEVEQQLADAREKHAQTLENERRANEAEALEKTAGLVDQKLAAVASAADALKAAVADLHSTLPANTALWPSWDRQEGARGFGGATPGEVVGALVAEIAHYVFPATFTWSSWRGTAALRDLSFSRLKLPEIRHTHEGRKPVTPNEAGQRLITDRLRELADQLRSGSEVERLRTIAEPVQAEPAAETDILVHSAFRFRVLPSWHTASGESQHMTVESHQVATVDVRVARAAIAAGHAEPAHTAEAREKAADYASDQSRAQNAWRTSPDDVADLGDPMGIETNFTPRAPRLVA